MRSKLIKDFQFNLNLSTENALGIWSELERCLQGNNGYGGNTAEIYAYILIPGFTNAWTNPESVIFGEDYKKLTYTAGRNLLQLCKKFSIDNEVKVLIESSNSWKDVWEIDESKFLIVHREHVMVK